MGLGMIYGDSRPLESQSTRAEFICDLQEVLMMINKTLSGKIRGFSIIQRRTVFLQEQSVTNTICQENRKNVWQHHRNYIQKKLPKTPSDLSFMHKENLRQPLKENKVHSAVILKRQIAKTPLGTGNNEFRSLSLGLQLKIRKQNYLNNQIGSDSSITI